MKAPRDDQHPEPSSCCRPPQDPVSRRTFLKLSGAGAAGVAFGASGVQPMAGPFLATELAEHLIPADKKLSAEWIGSLFRRGEPERYSGEELRFIGMPVGGICCGQLYLGGDGTLWRWDIFRSKYSSGYGGMSQGPHYANPPQADPTVEQGFALRVTSGGESEVRRLSREGFSDISFRGEYPIGRVSYRDPACSVEADLEAFSPFIPLDPDESALPATILSYRLRNAGDQAATVQLYGWLQNAVCPDHDRPGIGTRVNRILQKDGRLTLSCTAKPPSAEEETRSPMVFADFEGEDYEGWAVEGTAFGDGPIARADLRPYHDVSGHQGERLANSHYTRGGDDVGAADNHTGKLTSEAFTVERRFINFVICGGNHPGETCMNLVVDGKVVRTATGHNANRMRVESFDVTELDGKTAQLEIVDARQGGWGNIGIDHIVFADEAAGPELEELPGYGSMALTLLDENDEGLGASVVSAENLPEAAFPGDEELSLLSSAPFGSPSVGAVGREVALAPGEEVEVVFVLSWWFPYYPDPSGEFGRIQDIEKLNRHYENRFTGASEVAGYVVRNFERLAGATGLWNRTWYDSTLPYWLLDRSFIAIDCLATQTCHWFDSGRFWGWEGVDCCPGTCQHVWNYAQGLARIFPQLERTTREKIDYGIAFQESGELWYRAESAQHIAHDGQCGTILRAYRESLTAPDDRYVRRIWPRIKKSIEFLIAQDGGRDGLLEGRQYNTLDQAWYGPMAWISSMYVAALRAGERMAGVVGDEEFAGTCRKIAEAGTRNIVAELFDGEYFIHEPDPEHPEATNTNDGCHIDQLLGQSLAWQIGLDRVLPEEETTSALRALWKYNFAPDAGGYRDAMQDSIGGGRWYAMPGEAGLVMCSWPKGGVEKAGGDGASWAVGYFNECMTGFEYSVASHMIWEGTPDSDLVTKGLAVTRAIHDRYHASLRNPYNEIECSDHYSRAMAGYGVFLAACGFEYDGPRGHLGFAPRLSPNDFRAPFTAAEGWGTLRQTRTEGTQRSSITVRWGKLRLGQVSVEIPAETMVAGVTAGRGTSWKQEGSRVLVTLAESVELGADEALEIEVRY